MIRAGGAVENPARVRELRKAIARILTVEAEPAPLPKKEGKKEAKKEEKKEEKKAEAKEAPKKRAKKKEKAGEKKA